MSWPCFQACVGTVCLNPKGMTPQAPLPPPLLPLRGSHHFWHVERLLAAFLPGCGCLVLVAMLSCLTTCLGTRCTRIAADHGILFTEPYSLLLKHQTLWALVCWGLGRLAHVTHCLSSNTPEKACPVHSRPWAVWASYSASPLPFMGRTPL